MSFQKSLDKLESIECKKPEKILSMYLNTDRSTPSGQSNKWKIVLKNGLKRIEEYLHVSNEEEKMRFKKIRKKIEKYVYSLQRQLPRSIVVFASADGFWKSYELRVPVETSFFWEETPVLNQLKELYLAFPHTAYVLMQQNEVKVIDTSFGELHGSETYSFDLDTENWRRYEGPNQANIAMGSTGGKATKQDQFQERLKVNQERWWKSLGSELDEKATKEQWEQIYLVGDSEITDVVEKAMTAKIHGKIQKNILNKKEHEIMEEILS